jgi:hypothetical protein
MSDPRDRQLFDFSEQLTPANGRYNYRRPTPKSDGTAGFLIGLALAIQVAGALTLAIHWVPFVLIVFVGQLIAAIGVAADSKGKGTETAVWCLVALCFPFVGGVVYLIARE